MTLQELLLLVFCLVDGELKAPDLAHLRQRGSQPLLHDSGVITIELVGELHGRDRDARLFRHFRHYHIGRVPRLTPVPPHHLRPPTSGTQSSCSSAALPTELARPTPPTPRWGRSWRRHRGRPASPTATPGRLT